MFALLTGEKIILNVSGANCKLAARFSSAYKLYCAKARYSFMPFVVATALFTALLFFYLPETKGESVDQVVARLNAGGVWRRGLWKSSERDYERTD